MIHKVLLDPIIERRLKDLTDIQMILLLYGATRLAADQEECKALLEEKYDKKGIKKDEEFEKRHYKYLEDRCSEFLAQHTDFRGRARDIAMWVWASKERRERLLQFAALSGKFTRKQEEQERHAWYTQVKKQVDALMDNSNIIMSILYVGKDKEPQWKSAGASFLLQFYEDLRNGHKFPRGLFSSPDASAFSRQDFLDGFLRSNKGLYICAACDGMGYYSTSKAPHTMSGRNVHTEIEHYFPRSIYPHLSVHPYNLIPICGLCNSIHRDKDPFEAAGSRNLYDVFLPYRGADLSKDAYIDITLEEDVIQNKNREFSFANIAKLIPRPDVIDRSDVEKQIAVLQVLYEIPDRWNKDNWSNKVGETLFRRMRQFLRNSEVTPVTEKTLPIIIDTLDQFLSNLYQEDNGKDPFAFAMTWLLVAIVNDYFDAPLKGEDQASLLEEIESWFQQDREGNDKRAEIAQSLRGIARKVRSGVDSKDDFLLGKRQISSSEPRNTALLD